MEASTKNFQYKGLGRRKSSVARVGMNNGSGKILINGKTPEEYFPNALIIQDMIQALEVAECLNKYDIEAKVVGGGFSGQAGAIKLAISRALLTANNNSTEFKSKLKTKKLMSRDKRVKERKKVGKYGARRSPQFTKR